MFHYFETYSQLEDFLENPEVIVQDWYRHLDGRWVLYYNTVEGVEL